jgi:hypothetical protein
MDIVTILTLVVYAYVLIRQGLNWYHRPDGNGQDRVRFNFIVNIVLLVIIGLCIEYKARDLGAFTNFILSMCCAAFYHSFDLRRPFRWTWKMLKKFYEFLKARFSK